MSSLIVAFLFVGAVGVFLLVVVGLTMMIEVPLEAVKKRWGKGGMVAASFIPVAVIVLAHFLLP